MQIIADLTKKVEELEDNIIDDAEYYEQRIANLEEHNKEL
jgi:hypothetical protein